MLSYYFLYVIGYSYQSFVGYVVRKYFLSQYFFCLSCSPVISQSKGLLCFVVFGVFFAYECLLDFKTCPKSI